MVYHFIEVFFFFLFNKGGLLYRGRKSDTSFKKKKKIVGHACYQLKPGACKFFLNDKSIILNDKKNKVKTIGGAGWWNWFER
jgi:hypothetical protein